MLNPSPLLAQFESSYDRETWQADSFEAALRRFAALWTHARHLNPELGADWEDDLEADCAVARAVNGLSPRA